MKILIIKLGAAGDVLRTIPIAKVLKKKHPSSKIYWITKGDILQLLDGHPSIDKVVSLPNSFEEEFDILYNFDIDKEATELAKNVKATKKLGFYSEGEFPAAFNLGAEYYLNTLFDDHLKKTNKKTYQEMMFEAAELSYDKEDYEIYLGERDLYYANDFMKANELSSEKLIGIHMGASSRWPSKVWSEDKVKEFITKLDSRGYNILVFGGPNEVGRHEALVTDMLGKGVKVYQNNPNNTKREFAALVSRCKKMVCSDSLALHVSLALKNPTVGLFFCTSPDEVEGYGLLRKLISPMLYDFFPEKMDQYDEKLVNSISVEEVLSALEI